MGEKAGLVELVFRRYWKTVAKSDGKLGEGAGTTTLLVVQNLKV